MGIVVQAKHDAYVMMLQDDEGDGEEKWIQSAQDDYDDVKYFLETHLNKRRNKRETEQPKSAKFPE